VRERNEDNYFCDSGSGIWLVADGVGGNANGEIASGIVADEIPKLISSGMSHCQAIGQIHETIKRAPSKGIGIAGMATTLVLAQQCGANINISSVGDSRAYLYSKKKLIQLTKDHSLFQRFADINNNVREEMLFQRLKSVLTQCIGSLKMETLYPNEVNIKLVNDEKLLLCSDGLYNEVSKNQMEQIIDDSLTPKCAVERLIELAIKNGGSDNITAVLIDAHYDPSVS
jgi:protein phosphatase